MKSRKTTISGIITLIGMILLALGYLMDGNPQTNPDWAGLAEALQGLGALGGGIGAALTGWFARDDNVSSEGTVAEKDYK